MATELAKIQSYVPQAILNQLIEYQQTHNLKSVSQAIVVVLTEFFGIESSVYSVPSSNAEFVQRIERLEVTVTSLIEQLALLEQGSASPGLSPSLPQSQSENLYSLASLEQEQLNNTYHDSEGDSESESLCSPDRLQSQSNGIDSASVSVPLLPEDWVRGIGTNQLVARLNTNPTTLKKYLRDLKQVQWAVQRDPEGLGWTYDPLLERYYPNKVENISSIDSEFEILELKQAENQQEIKADLRSTEASVSDSNQSQFLPGLSQAQLSRLAKVPVNTLQRWKHLADCTERIRRRTDDRFSYWYSEKSKRFYPTRN